ncbi:hypothetical protein KCU61_g150, partial [Aureobasidium melanogenum]
MHCKSLLRKREGDETDAPLIFSDALGWRYTVMLLPLLTYFTTLVSNVLSGRVTFAFRYDHCCMICNDSDTLNGASVFDLISSTVTPSACSINVNPVVKSTSNTANSVMILETQALPVNGNSHIFMILGPPFLSVCSIVTTTLVFSGLETKSMAPPMPLIFPGIANHVDSASADHGKRLIRAKDCGTRTQRNSLFTSIDEIRVFLALLRVCSQTQDAVLGLKLDFNAVLAYIPFLNSLAARRTMRSRLLAASPLPSALRASAGSFALTTFSMFLGSVL